MTQTDITLETIAAAERIAGVGYTEAERHLMLDNLEGQIVSALQRRAVPLANSVPMAMRFDPRLPGFAMPHGADAVRVSKVTVKPKFCQNENGGRLAARNASSRLVSCESNSMLALSRRCLQILRGNCL